MEKRRDKAPSLPTRKELVAQMVASRKPCYCGCVCCEPCAEIYDVIYGKPDPSRFSD